ncbi:hypothetical protein [Idiomarina abyssalis]|uniref:hypothetical protein n=1 Tax=Idiomarina abyssalis TaxID=86102 RepID=UPI003A8F50B0
MKFLIYKKMKKLLFKSLILIFIGFFLVDLITDPLFKNNNNVNKVFKELNKFDQDTLDILFIGSSHSKSTFKPSIFDSVFNSNSFNIGTGGQRYMLTNLLLEDVLKKRKVELAVIDLYPTLLSLPKEQNTKGFQLRVLDNVSFSLNKLAVINEIYDFKEVPSVLSTTIRNHNKWYDVNFKRNDFNKSFTSDKGWLTSKKRMNKKNREKYTNFLEQNRQFLNVELTQLDLNKFAIYNSYIQETVRICEKYNTKFCFVSAPYFESFYNKQINKKHYYLKELLEDKNIPFIDFNSKYNAIDLNLDDFKDRDHLNIKGSRKVSAFFAKYLSEKKYFEIKNQKYYNEIIEEIKPRNLDSVARIINKNRTILIEQIVYKGNKVSGRHELYSNLKLEGVFFYETNNVKYIAISKNRNEHLKTNDNMFLLRGEIFKSDFKNRPKNLLKTKKDKLLWSVKADTISIEDNDFYLLKLKNRGNISSYKSFSIFTFDEKGDHLRKGYIMKNVSFIN